MSRPIAIIGGYGQLGRAIAGQSGDADRLLLIGRDAEKLSAAARPFATRARTAVADASDRDALAAAFAESEPLDALFLPVGGPGATGRLADLKEEAIEQAIAAKLTAQILSIRAALPALRDNAVVVLFSGVLSRAPMPGTAVFAAINAGIEALTVTLATEFAPRRLICISPSQVVAEDQAQPGQATPDMVARAAWAALDLPASGITIDVPLAAPAVGRS